MIKAKEAIEIAKNEMRGLTVDTVIDIPDGFVIGFSGRNGEEIVLPPLYVSKKTGETKAFFPPEHYIELKKGILLDLSDIN